MPQVRVAAALAALGLALVGCGESHAQEAVSAEAEVPAEADASWKAPTQKYPVAWELIHSEEDNYGLTRVERTKVPGGWLVRSLHKRSTSRSNCPMNGAGHACGMAAGVGLGESMTFVPDPGHAWDATP